MFIVIRITSENATTYTPTLHTSERQAREAVVKSLGGKPYKSYIVDTNHPNGLEVHTILTSGVIVIGNLRNRRLVTWLVARPNQLKRYGIVDNELIQKAYGHTVRGLNK